MMERKIKYPVFIGMFIAMLVFSPPLAFAQQEPIPAVLPDSFFYNFKLLIENIQEAFTLQEDRKAELLLKHAEERDIEARALEAQGKMIPLERLKQIQADKIMKAEQIIIRLEQVNAQLVESQQERAERQLVLQAQSEAERIQILQRIEDAKARPDFLEPTTDRVTIFESQFIQRAETPIEILPVEDIKDTDEVSVILQKLRDRLTNAKTNPKTTYGFTILPVSLGNSTFNPSKTTNPKKKKIVATANNTLVKPSFTTIQHHSLIYEVDRLELV